MIGALRKAFELALQQPEDEQEVIVQLILEEFRADEHWNELLTHPKSVTLLEQLAEQARKYYSARLTHILNKD